MFNWLKNIIRTTQSITPTTNLPDGTVKQVEPIFLETRIRNYTENEFNVFINELKRYDNGFLRIDTQQINSRNIVGNIYYGHDSVLQIDLSRKTTDYYLNTCKNIHYLF